MAPRRLLSALAMFALVAAGCTYESSGTTTTTTVAVEDRPAPTSPGSLIVSDQRSEGSSVTIDSVALPSPGWVVLRADSGGSPGELIGISDRLPAGFITGVTVPLLIPLAEDATVHLALHVDVDDDGSFVFEPPDAFVDGIATTTEGDPVTAVVRVTLLPPLSPGDAFVEEQTTDGTTLDVASALLPAAGFVALHANEGGEPGEVLAVTDLLEAGEVTEFAFEVDPPLATTGIVFVVVWVDRDEDGVFAPGEGTDAVAIRSDGGLAVAEVVMTVIPTSPAAVEADDQEVTGNSFVVASVESPATGFLEVLSDASGEPGERVAVVPVGIGSFTDLSVDLPDGFTSGDRLWLRLWVEFDGDGALSAGDLPALAEAGGTAIEVSLTVTVIEEE
ncbi:MAG: hypothetical protein QY307_08275 [Acidimicrobiia bacterium]|nr:MAG: hypothetical protein QY307_08275 [Acidimicrobiia bacterium]